MRIANLRNPRRSPRESVPWRRRVASSLVAAAVLLLLTASSASADITGFVGVNTTPVKRPVKGLAIGTGLLIVGFEAEYADTSEDLVLAGPRLRTFMFNGLAQTPIPIARMQFYATAGRGIYQRTFPTPPPPHPTNPPLHTASPPKTP